MSEHGNTIDQRLLAIAETRIAEARQEFPCELCSKCQWRNCHLAGAYRARQYYARQIKGAGDEARQ